MDKQVVSGKRNWSYGSGFSYTYCSTRYSGFLPEFVSQSQRILSTGWHSNARRDSCCETCHYYSLYSRAKTNATYLD